MVVGPVTKLKVCENLNPATFLPEKENETLDRDCSQFITLSYAAQEDLMDTPLDTPDIEIFTDGSSLIRDGEHKAGYAVVTAEQVLEAKSLPHGTAAHCPKEVDVMHCKGQNRDGSKVAEGNQLANCQARKVAFYETPSLQTNLIWTGPVEQEKPQHTKEELERYEKRGAKITDRGWLQSEDGQLITPESAQWKILKGLHQSFHLGADSTYQMASLCLKVKM